MSVTALNKSLTTAGHFAGRLHSSKRPRELGALSGASFHEETILSDRLRQANGREQALDERGNLEQIGCEFAPKTS